MLRQQGPEAARWGLCFALVACVHAGGAWALLANWNSDDLIANPPAIVIDLAPVAAAPDTVQTDIPIGPQQVEFAAEPEPEPEKPVEPPPPETKVQLEPPPPPPAKPKEDKKEKPKKKEKRAKQTTARTRRSAAPRLRRRRHRAPAAAPRS